MKFLSSNHTLLMGVLNVTPDSFSDGGRFFDKDTAIAHGIEMAGEGADIIDVGGESTRPGAKEVRCEEEIRRVIPVIEKLAGRTKAAISVDTQKSRVAEAALKAGASIVNDISGLKYDKDMAGVAARYGAGMILMHMKGRPENMQDSCRYSNLISEIRDSLRFSANEAFKAGVKKDSVAIDPGIGFGKTVEQNLEILNRLEEFKNLGLPLCVGTSRKSFIGKLLDSPGADDILAGTIASCVAAVIKGVRILRIHDVKAVRDAVTITEKISGAKRG